MSCSPRVDVKGKTPIKPSKQKLDIFGRPSKGSIDMDEASKSFCDALAVHEDYVIGFSVGKIWSWSISGSKRHQRSWFGHQGRALECVGESYCLFSFSIRGTLRDCTLKNNNSNEWFEKWFFDVYVSMGVFQFGDRNSFFGGFGWKTSL